MRRSREFGGWYPGLPDDDRAWHTWARRGFSPGYEVGGPVDPDDLGRHWAGGGDDLAPPVSAPAYVGAGRGPRSYVRSDERIRDDVWAALLREGLDVDDVDVQVAEGEVTVVGTVGHKSERWRIEEIVEGVLGVREVHTRVRVRPPS